MRNIRPSHLVLFSLALISSLAVDHTFAQVTPQSPVPLALVGEDTLTTTHLRIELAIMKNRNEQRVSPAALEPAKVLRRLTQNQLVIQEGYRMGLDQEFTVANQVLEVVRHECMAALLDSVALSVPKETPDFMEARRLAVKGYIEDLQAAYQARVDSTVLVSLDYGSDDPDMQKHLRESEEVLAVVPTGNLTVSAFSRIVRFSEFHGLVGKPNADERRDDVLREWFAEALLNYQYQAQGMDRNPEMVMIAQRMERTLVLEESLGILLESEFSPTDPEVESYYQAHLADVTPAPRVKMESLKVGSEEQAKALFEKMLRGTPVSWLYSNDPTVIQGPSPFPEEYFKPEQLGLQPAMLEVGYIPQPYQVPTGWVVARISEIEDPDPTPLADCRPRILSMMEAEHISQTMVAILERLEEVSPIIFYPGAEETTAMIIREFEAQEAAAHTEPVAIENEEG